MSKLKKYLAWTSELMLFCLL